MGEIEAKAKKYRRRVRIQDTLLQTLFGTAGLTFALMAPNAARLLKHLDVDFERKRSINHRMQQALKRLEEKGLIKRTGNSFVLTAKGERLADQISHKNKVIPEVPRKWDGMWRVVIFDIWEKRRIIRARLRRMLLRIGFLKIQDSVWVYPYDCEELVAFFRTELKLGPSVIYLIAQGIENDFPYRKHFKLPLR